MEALFIERTETTPQILLDSDNLEFTINGNSLPGNSQKFYKPVLDWIDSFEAQFAKTARPLSIEVRLKQYNQDSFGSLLEFFEKINKLHRAGLRVIIDWILVNDEFSRQVGQDLSDESGLPFNFVENYS
jgi:hypothetical protein